MRRTDVDTHYPFPTFDQVGNSPINVNFNSEVGLNLDCIVLGFYLLSLQFCLVIYLYGLQVWTLSKSLFTFGGHRS